MYNKYSTRSLQVGKLYGFGYADDSSDKKLFLAIVLDKTPNNRSVYVRDIYTQEEKWIESDLKLINQKFDAVAVARYKLTGKL